MSHRGPPKQDLLSRARLLVVREANGGLEVRTDESVVDIENTRQNNKQERFCLLVGFDLESVINSESKSFWVELVLQLLHDKLALRVAFVHEAVMGLSLLGNRQENLVNCGGRSASNA